MGNESQNHSYQVYSQHGNLAWNPYNWSGAGHVVTCIGCHHQYRQPCSEWAWTGWGLATTAQCTRLCTGCWHNVDWAFHTGPGASCTRCHWIPW
jgi:hypothetical protein